MNYTVMIRRGHRRALLEIMCRYFIDKLELKNSKYSLVVMSQKGMIDEVNASASTFKAKEVIILTLDANLSIEKLMISFAHEMVHVKQIARGTLDHDQAGNFKWRGKESEDMHYLDRPWELEAFAKQEILVREFEHHLGVFR